MKIKKILLSLLFALSLLLIACGENDAITISLSGDDSVKVNNTINLVAKASDNSTDFNWSSSDESIATVSNSGLVTGISVGNVTVTVSLKKDSSVKATKNIKVESDGEVSYDLKVSKNKVLLTVGESDTVVATVEPNTSLVWSSNDESIATVSDGKITALKAGSTIITVATSNNEAKAEISVVVKEKEVGYTAKDLMRDLTATKEQYTQADSVNILIETSEGTCEMIYNKSNDVYQEFKYSVTTNVSSNIYIKDGILYSNIESAKTKNTLSSSEALSIVKQYNASMFLEDVASYYDEDAFFVALTKKQETNEFVEFELTLADYLGELNVEGVDSVVVKATLDNGKITSVELIFTTKGVSSTVKVYYRGTEHQEISYPSDLDSYTE